MKILEQITIEVDGQVIAVSRMSDGSFRKPEYLRQAERTVIGREKTKWTSTGRNQRYGKLDYFDTEDGYEIRETTAPATDAAKQWNGWGTALKPAHEPIVLARKPLIGTVAENVLKHGTGGLNIDGCRIATNELTPRNNKIGDNGWKNSSGGYTEPSPLGRWPANVITDGSDEVLARFPQTENGYRANPSTQSGSAFHANNGAGERGHNDTGSAARFFYCAKADQADRNEGCEDLPHRVADEVHKRPRTELDDPRRHGVTPRQNNHPTVKPTELMRYLCRLITPPGGIVLDPFTGSGSTGKGAMLEGLKFIGIELSEDYCQLAQRRIEAVTKQGMLFA